MKKNDFILIGIIVAIALVCFGVFQVMKKDGASVTVTVDGKQYGTYSLLKDDIVEIKSDYGTNQLVIKDHIAKMEDASCPDKLCIHQHAIDKTGQTIVCLPNKVVVTVENAEEDEVDITTR